MGDKKKTNLGIGAKSYLGAMSEALGGGQRGRAVSDRDVQRFNTGNETKGDSSSLTRDIIAETVDKDGKPVLMHAAGGTVDTYELPKKKKDKDA